MEDTENMTYKYDCQKDYKCANCQGNYGAGSRDCAAWKKEKEITKLKHGDSSSNPGRE